MSSPLSSADVGFTVAPGDSGLITDARTRFDGIADGLDEHGLTVVGTATSLSPSWTGTSASAYLNLSGAIGTHFQTAAGSVRNIASALGEYSSELDRCQRAGTVAMAGAERCLETIQTQASRLDAARAAGTGAQSALSTAHANGTAARAAGPLGVVAAAVADAAAAAAQAALATAQAEEQAAERALTQAEEELLRWQAHGRRAQSDAESAAGLVGRVLLGLTLVPPPLADLAPFPPLEPTPPGSLIVHDKEEGEGDQGNNDGEGEKKDPPIEDPDRNPKQDKILSPGEIKELKKADIDPEALKGEESGADLYKDRQGNIYVKPKGGAGPGDPTGININDL